MIQITRNDKVTVIERSLFVFIVIMNCLFIKEHVVISVSIGVFIGYLCQRYFFRFVFRRTGAKYKNEVVKNIIKAMLTKFFIVSVSLILVFKFLSSQINSEWVMVSFALSYIFFHLVNGLNIKIIANNN